MAHIYRTNSGNDAGETNEQLEQLKRIAEPLPSVVESVDVLEQTNTRFQQRVNKKLGWRGEQLGWFGIGVRVERDISDGTRVIARHHHTEGRNVFYSPRPDAVLIEFKWQGRTPTDFDAVANAPDCMKKGNRPAVQILEPGPHPGRHITTPEISMRCDGNYSNSVILKVAELTELVNWLDRYFSDMGADVYGGHWRESYGAYGEHCFSFADYTEEELNAIRKRESIWATFEPYLSNKDY